MTCQFTIGAPVLVEEGEAGHLRFVVVDPSREVVTDLIVERGFLLKSSKVVPSGWVKYADQNAIHLNSTLSDLDSLPDYYEFEFAAPDPSAQRMAGYAPEHVKLWALPLVPEPAPRLPLLAQRIRLGVNPNTAIVGRGTRVDASDCEVVGVVDHVLADPETKKVTHLIVHPRFRLGHSNDLLVSIDQVSGFGEESIQLSVTKDELEQAPQYRPAATDAQIKSRLTRSLETQAETRESGIQVDVDRGLVTLLGKVLGAVAQTASEIAHSIRGVVGVNDHTRRVG